MANILVRSSIVHPYQAEVWDFQELCLIVNPELQAGTLFCIALTLSLALKLPCMHRDPVILPTCKYVP